MVIDVLIYIVHTEDIKRFCMLKVRRDTVMAIDRYKMCATKDRMYMNHLHFSPPICIKIRFYNPQPSVFIRLVRNCCKPLDECTGVLDTIIGKGKNKNTRPTWSPFMPGSSWSFSRNTVSHRAGPFLQYGVLRIHSECIPPRPDKSLGA